MLSTVWRLHEMREMQRTWLVVLALSGCAEERPAGSRSFAEGTVTFEPVQEIYVRNDADRELAGALTFNAITKYSGATDRTETHLLFIPFGPIAKGAPASVVVSTLLDDRMMMVGGAVQKITYRVQGAKVALVGGLVVAMNYQARIEKPGNNAFSAKLAQVIALKKKGAERVADVEVGSESCAALETADIELVADDGCDACLTCDVVVEDEPVPEDRGAVNR